MFRRLLLSAALVAIAAPALAASCDINADQAAVVAAWGEKVKANSLPAEQLADISQRIQNLPTLAASDEEATCAELQALKVELGLMPAP